MGLAYNEIPDDPKLIEWLLDQKLFHVATAPLNGGHVNVSPKGLPTFKLVNRKACWYLDLSGSGNETISHLYEPGNARITLMWQAFEGSPRIFRIFGTGKVFELGTPEYEKLLTSTDGEYNFPTPEPRPGARAIIWIDIHKVSFSCGFSVPLMEFVSERTVMDKWAEKLEAGDAHTDDPYSLPFDRGFKQWLRTMNSWSIDGLPGMKLSNDATSELIRQTMLRWGLDPPTSSPRSTSSSAWMLLFGLLLGIVSSALAQKSGLLASVIPRVY